MEIKEKGQLLFKICVITHIDETQKILWLKNLRYMESWNGYKLTISFTEGVRFMYETMAHRKWQWVWAPTARRPKSAFSTNNFPGKLISEWTPKIKQNKRKWNNDESKDMMALMILHWSSSCNRPVTPLPHSHLTSPITSEKQTARAQLNGSNLLFGKNFTPLSKPRP